MSKFRVIIRIPTTVEYEVEADTEERARDFALAKFAADSDLALESDFENASVDDIFASDDEAAIDAAVERGHF